MEENNHYEKKETIGNETANAENVDVKEKTILPQEEENDLKKEEEKKKDFTFLFIVIVIIVIFIFFMPTIYKKLNPTTVKAPSKEPEKVEEKRTNITYTCMSRENDLVEGYEISRNTTYLLINDKMNSIKINDTYSFENEQQYLDFKEKIEGENSIGEFDDTNFNYFYKITLNSSDLQNKKEYPATKDDLLKLIEKKKMDCSITEK